MFRNHRNSVLTLLLAAIVVAAAGGPALGQDSASVPGNKKLTIVWDDLLHYIRIARADLALAQANNILSFGAQPREIYLLSQGARDSMAVLSRGRGLTPELAKAIVRIEDVIKTGYINLRRDAKEIAKSIQMLGESELKYAIALSRLKLSGEFALPQLIEKLMSPDTPKALKDRIVTVFPVLGLEAVNGLRCALQSKDPKVRVHLATVLGQIEYGHAAARLHELMDLHAERDPKSPAKRHLLDETYKVAKASFIACMKGDPAALKKTTSELFYDLALRYYYEYQAESLRPDEQFDEANIWYWDEEIGLKYLPVPREIFCEIYAMRMARLALKHDPKNYPAVSLWLSAYIKKEAGLASGKKDPTHVVNGPTAWFYTLASSPRYVKEVVARGLKDAALIGYGSPVIIGALNALAETHGSEPITKPLPGGAEPVVACLTYPDRHVRFLAAVTLGNAHPNKRFTGYPLVMTVLNEALRQTGKKVAVLIVKSQETRNLMKAAVRAAGYVVIDEPNAEKALEAARATPGVDAVVMGELPVAAKVLPMLRKDPMFVLTPVVLAATGDNIRRVAAADGKVALISPRVTNQEVRSGLAKAAALSIGGPMTKADSDKWAIRAARSIRGLGLTKTRVYDISRTRQTLIAALRTAGNPDVKIAAAEALAVIRGAESQRPIVDSACRRGGLRSVRIACFNAAAESVRRHNRLISEAQAKAVVDVVVGKESLKVREAAAKLLGALNLPSAQIKALVLQGTR